MSLPIKMAHTEIVGQVTRDSIPTVCSVASCYTSTSILTTRSGVLCVHSVPALTYLQKRTNMIKQLNLLTLYLSEIGILSGPSTDRVNDGNSSIYSKKDLPLQQKIGIKSHFSHFAMYSFKCYSKTLCLEWVLNRTEVWRRDLRSKRNSYYSPEPIAFFRIKPFAEIGTCQSWARHVMDICGRKHI